MKLTPLVTEKTTNEAKEGKYTFFVDPSLKKRQIKSLINKTFAVHVVSIRTMNKVKLIRKNYLGRKKTENSRKKAIVTLKDKEKIDLFETKGGKK